MVADLELISNTIKDFDSLYPPEELIESVFLIQNKGMPLNLDGKDSLLLAPFVDLFKYKKDSNVEWDYDKEREERSGIFIHATKAIAQGDELYFSYGNTTN